MQIAKNASGYESIFGDLHIWNFELLIRDYLGAMPQVLKISPFQGDAINNALHRSIHNS